MTKLLARLAAFLLVALVGAGLTVTPVAADGPASDRSTARYEADFLMGMIDHHAMAIEMAEMCLDKAIHPELEAMCESIIAAQSQEIVEMQAWLQDWYGITYEPEMTSGDMRQMDKLAALDGAAFEIEFMESMIGHHRKAIREAEECLQRAEHPELLGLCQNIIDTQSGEIAQMQQWLCEWYGRCKGRRAEA